MLPDKVKVKGMFQNPILQKIDDITLNETQYEIFAKKIIKRKARIAAKAAGEEIEEIPLIQIPYQKPIQKQKKINKNWQPFQEADSWSPYDN